MNYKTKAKKRCCLSNNQRNENKLLIAIGFYVALAILAFNASISWVSVGWYVLIGFFTFLIYVKDKRAAENKSWRVSESSLHSLSVIGGWAGVMIAQHFLRHKTQKSDFKLMYHLTVIINLAFLLYMIIN